MRKFSSYGPVQIEYEYYAPRTELIQQTYDVARQETEYMALRQRWKIASPAQVTEVLAKREEVEPEPELKQETVRKLRQRIEEQRVMVKTASE